MKVIVVGGSSFIASHLGHYQIVDDRLDTSMASIDKLINKYNPSIIINCLGFAGGKSIDGCEINKQKTLESNLCIPVLLAERCRQLGIMFIHIGSGCLFYTASPNKTADNTDAGWKETDTVNLNGASFYSKIKYAADLAIASMPNACIARIRMPISSNKSPRNLITKLLGFNHVLEELNSVTILSDLVRAIDWMIEHNKSGIYNVTNPEPITHIDILERYKRYYSTHQYTTINKEQLSKLVVSSRSNCILNTEKLNREGFFMTPTHQALNECMVKYVMDNK